MNQNSVFAESVWEFRLPEIVLFVVILIINFCIFYADKNLIPVFPIVSCFAYIMFVVDHKSDLVMNRDSNTFLLTEKMLFFNKYRVKRKYNLEEIQSATVMTNFNIDRRRGARVTYNVVIQTVHYGAFNLFPYSSSNYLRWMDMAQRINTFLAGDAQSFVLNDNPFLFRMLSIIPTFIAFMIIFDMFIN